MGEPAPRLATYEDVLNAPEGMTAELIGGELYVSPRPAPDHAMAEGGVYGDLSRAFSRRRSGHGGWWILAEPEIHLRRLTTGFGAQGFEVASPDVAGWRRERMPVPPRTPAIELAPDWLCEVLSLGPRNVRRDRILKPDLYAACGIPHLWIVDPVAETLEVHRLQGTVYARVQAFAGDVRVRAKPFEAVELDLGEWWLSTEE